MLILTGLWMIVYSSRSSRARQGLRQLDRSVAEFDRRITEAIDTLDRAAEKK
ncbi:MAG: hypothetical protein JW782_02925 [Candidatus Saganbacteria bacterium]|nr:hypothetical protein [Candidatus Saganbacteria bacterium]